MIRQLPFKVPPSHWLIMGWFRIVGGLEADQCAEHNGSLANMLGGTSKEGIGRASPIDKLPAGWAVRGQGAGNGASGSKPTAKC